MKLQKNEADLFVPDGTAMPSALERTTHLCVGAHQDDQEFMAYHGIAECFGRADRWFTGVVVTDGGGSARAGLYADYSDDDMKAVRASEQRKAAFIGEYGCQIQLAYPSSVVKDSGAAGVVEDLQQIFQSARPQVVYLHNPADKHDTHVACCLRAIDALRTLPVEDRPARVLGCEIWRDLDWLVDEDKQVLPVDSHENLAAALSGVFDSQLCGGKRYDLAIQGRRRAHATMFDSHAVDESEGLSWALDLTPLIHDADASVVEYALGFIDRLREDVIARAARVGGR
jgi:LmbE family N-acetylglucosaminyl deacetylase